MSTLLPKPPEKLSPRKRVKKGNKILKNIENAFDFVREMNKITGGLLFVGGSYLLKKEYDKYSINKKLVKLIEDYNSKPSKELLEKIALLEKEYFQVSREQNKQYIEFKNKRGKKECTSKNPFECVNEFDLLFGRRRTKRVSRRSRRSRKGSRRTKRVSRRSRKSRKN
jgi:hypothetical protein